MVPVSRPRSNPLALPLGSTAACLLVASLASIGCTDGTSPAPGPEGTPSAAAGPVGPAMLVVELTAGVQVAVDGGEPQAGPLPPRELPPGPHAVTLVTACERVELAVELVAGETTRVDAATAKGLERSTLELVVKDREGQPLAHSVRLGEQVVAGGQGASKVTVPACMQRVHVSSEGLGGFIEDVDFGKERAVRREVVLLPGPDLVRIHGGTIVLGPPEASKETWQDEEGYLIFSQIPAEVETFDLDRTEVTAAQWMECRRAGGCQEQQGKWWATQHPSDLDRPRCNVDTGKLEPVMASGRDDHPMNCVARWEAEDYCLWAGKRLPNAIEWEYAARSGDDQNLWPWGNDIQTCEHSVVDGARTESGEYAKCGVTATAPVCSRPKGNSVQGLCDLVGNVEEYVAWTEFAKKDRFSREYTCMGGRWNDSDHEVFRGGICSGRDEQRADRGFRCARTPTPVKGAH